MEQLFRVRDFIIRHMHSGQAGLHRADRKIEDRVQEPKQDAIARLRNVYEPAEFSCKTTNEVCEAKYNLQIIIPMYNMQRYIIDCLDSIFSQKTDYTYKVILIDDGSTDSATPLVKEKFKEFNNLEIIRHANRGTAAARNEGLAKIEADYIMFVDADDMLRAGAIDLLLRKAYEENACVVEGGYELFARGVPIYVTHPVDEMVNYCCGKFWGFACVKVFKADLFADICFPEGYWFEDTIISYIVYAKCEKAYAVKDVVYRYRRNIKGFSHIRGNDVKLLDSFWVFYYVIKEMEARKIEVTQNVYEAILSSMVTCCKRLYFMNDEIRKQVLNVFSMMLNEDYKGMKCQDANLSIFEKTVRNNDFYKFRKILPRIKE